MIFNWVTKKAVGNTGMYIHTEYSMENNVEVYK